MKPFTSAPRAFLHSGVFAVARQSFTQLRLPLRAAFLHAFFAFLHAFFALPFFPLQMPQDFRALFLDARQVFLQFRNAAQAPLAALAFLMPALISPLSALPQLPLCAFCLVN